MITRAKTNAGFTLIELMIAVAVVGMLSAIAYPSFLTYIAKGKRTECRGGILQTLQQQERYFTQYNRYAVYAANATNPPTKQFSGDTLAVSACTIHTSLCAGAADATGCIEVRATPRATDPDGIDYIFLNSDGAKGCSVSGTRPTTTLSICWP